MKGDELQTLLQHETPLMQALANGEAMLGSQAIIALNLADYSFPHWAADDQLKEVEEIMRRSFKKDRHLKRVSLLPLSELSETEKMLLQQRELLPPLPPGAAKRGLILLDPCQLFLGIINGEEHLLVERFISCGPGRSLTSALWAARAIQGELADHLHVGLAWDEEFQFLMADPLKSGDGLSVACWMNLPALVQTGELENVQELVCEAKLQMRPAFGVPEEAMPDVFRIDQQAGEPFLLSEFFPVLRKLGRKLGSMENQKRKKMLTQKRLGAAWENRLSHTLELIRKGTPVSEKDLPGMLSLLRLGVTTKKLHVNCTPDCAKTQLVRAHLETQSSYITYSAVEDGLPADADTRRGEVLRRLVTEQLQINDFSIKN